MLAHMSAASVTLLKHVALFSGLSDKELGAIATLLRERTFSAGTEVVTGDLLRRGIRRIER